MVDKDAHDEKWDIADRLRREAKETRPEFSESLHMRICRAVEQSEMAEPPRPVALPYLSRGGITAAVAATLAVGVLYLVWQGNSPSGLFSPSGSVPKPGEIVSSAGQEKAVVNPDPRPNEALSSPIDVPGNPAVEIGLLVDSTLTNRRWAYLDHDVQLATRMLLDQLPGSIVWPEEEL
jgi:hypothetical protein